MLAQCYIFAIKLGLLARMLLCANRAMLLSGLGLAWLQRQLLRYLDVPAWPVVAHDLLYRARSYWSIYK